MGSLALFLLNGGTEKLRQAVKAFDQPDSTATWPRAGEPDWLANKFAEKDADGPAIDLFNRDCWSAGTFLVYDLLAKLWGEKAAPVESERTPILVVNADPTRRQASVLWLTVERRHGGEGLILPDWWSMGRSLGEGDEHFRSAIDQAIRAARPNDSYRLTWRLAWHAGLGRPEVLTGRSAQASAACCARPSASPGGTGPEPLLDENVAVSACLVDAERVALDRIKLGEVDKDSFKDKLDAACCAGWLM